MIGGKEVEGYRVPNDTDNFLINELDGGIPTWAEEGSLRYTNVAEKKDQVYWTGDR